MNSNNEESETAWVEYKEFVTKIESIFQKAIGQKLLGICGDIQDNDWNPNEPLILHFPTIKIAINTQRSYLWSLYELKDNQKFYKELLNFPSVIEYFDLKNITGLDLKTVRIGVFNGINYLSEESILLDFHTYLLNIYDAGDELGIEVFKRVFRTKASFEK